MPINLTSIKKDLSISKSCCDMTNVKNGRGSFWISLESIDENELDNVAPNNFCR